jgi:protein-arginine kinase activator protein McsA
MIKKICKNCARSFDSIRQIQIFCCRACFNDWHTGENHVNAHLTNAKANLIRKKFATGKFTQMYLALRHGVSQSTISGIINDKSYNRK